jgi:5-methylcytosine-specific restriction enzyme A
MPRAIGTFRHQGGARPARTSVSPAARQADKNFYSSARWIRLRNLVRAEEPLCRGCLKQGRVAATEHVDHIVDRKRAPQLAYERSNLQGLCKGCHNAKRSS